MRALAALEFGKVRLGAGRDDDDVRPFALDHRAIDFRARAHHRAGQRDLAGKIGDDAAKLGTTGQ